MSKIDNKAMYQAYDEIALERQHVCTGCGSKNNLSHSHLVSRGDQELKAVKANIQYHCLSMGEKVGCHTLWEGVDFWRLKDAYENMKYVYSVRPSHFWLKLNKAIEAHEKVKMFMHPKIAIGPQPVYRDPIYTEACKALEALERIKQIAA